MGRPPAENAHPKTVWPSPIMTWTAMHVVVDHTLKKELKLPRLH